MNHKAEMKLAQNRKISKVVTGCRGNVRINTKREQGNGRKK